MSIGRSLKSVPNGFSTSTLMVSNPRSSAKPDSGLRDALVCKHQHAVMLTTCAAAMMQVQVKCTASKATGNVLNFGYIQAQKWVGCAQI